MNLEDNEQNKRWSQLLSSVDKYSFSPDEKFLEQLREKSTAEFIESSANKVKEPQTKTLIPIWRIIMKSSFMKIAASFVILLIVFSVLSLFSNSNTSLTSIAFGEVLSQIKNSNYTFNMTEISPEGKAEPEEVMICNGVMRIDDVFVNIITDLKTGDFVLLWHESKVAVNKIPEGIDELEAGLQITLAKALQVLAKPIENLWDLQDGTETSLGEKEIDGQTASGFEVQQEKDGYKSKIIVWANSKTGSPIRVEITFSITENPEESYTKIMDNFNMNAELNPADFTLNIPDEYIIAYEKSLEDIITGTENNAQAQKIMQSLELFKENKEQQAIEMLLNINWDEPIEFSDKIYLFTITEKEFPQLFLKDQRYVRQENKVLLKTITDICNTLRETAETAKTQGDYSKAEEYLKVSLNLGGLLFRNPELLMLTLANGYAIQYKSLDDLEVLYEETNNQEKLKQTKADKESLINRKPK